MNHKSVCIGYAPCTSCGSSDGNGLFDDGHSYCFVCKKVTKGDKMEQPQRRQRKPLPMISELEFGPLPKRGLTEETCRHWGYATGEFHGDPCQVAQYRNREQEIIAQKIRLAGKEFRWLGNRDGIRLFGEHLWRDSGSRVVITEGEIDAMSVSQAQGLRWPVVSVPDGASSATTAVQNSLDWLEGYDNVVFMFDNDEPGRKAAHECAALMSPGKAFISFLPLKDANEMLVAGREKEIIDGVFGAKAYRPDGIVAGTDIWEKIVDTRTFESLPYPWSGVNRLTRGLRAGEMVVVAAGTGVGKSEVVRAIAANLHNNQNETIGYVALEESVQRTALGLIGLDLGRRLHVDPGDLNDPAIRESYARTVGSGRYFLYDHWGSLEGDHLLQRIRYMVRALGCRTVVLDHISIVVSGTDTSDERKTIDLVMTKLRSMVEELQFRLIIVTHLRRVEEGHEDGGRVSMGHIRGSGSIGQLANIVIALERDVGSGKNRVTMRVLKNRHSGQTGDCGDLAFDPKTGWITEAEPEPPEKQTTEGSPF